MDASKEDIKTTTGKTVFYKLCQSTTTGMDMVELLDTIKTVMENTKKSGENIFSNMNISNNYFKYNKPGHNWPSCAITEYPSGVPKYKFPRLNWDIMENRGQGRMGATYPRHNREGNKQCFHINVMNFIHWIGRENQTVLSKYTIYQEMILASCIITVTQPFPMRDGIRLPSVVIKSFSAIIPYLLIY